MKVSELMALLAPLPGDTEVTILATQITEFTEVNGNNVVLHPRHLQATDDNKIAIYAN